MKIENLISNRSMKIEEKESQLAVNTLTEREEQRLKLERQWNSELDAKLAANVDKFPKAVYSIILNEMGERFCFFGIKNLLNQYLKAGFGMKEEVAKSQVHLFNGLVYLFPLVGAAISDSFLGKFRTIFYFSMIYLAGNILLSIFSINNLLAPFGEYPYWSYLLPAVLIAIGAGGIKPCVSTHGGDQFLSTQSHLLDKFFSIFHVGICFGALVAKYLTPLLKNHVTCFGSSCYFLAYGIPSLVFILTLGLFLIGNRYYRVVPPQGEFLPWKAAKLTFLAFTRRWKATPTERQEKSHWLEFSQPEFDPEFIKETRLLGKMMVMATPIIFFWALYDQNGTEWQNQYEKMDKTVFGLIPIPTEASSSVISILLLIVVPTLVYFVYPWLETKNIKMSLMTRMIWGYVFLILSFIVSTLLDYIVNQYTQNIVYTNDIVTSCSGCLNGAWQLPQYFLLSLGEALLGPSCNQFSYTQVGSQMKAASSSLVLLTVALGNYFVFLMEFPLDYFTSTTNQQWVYIAITSIALLSFIILDKYWFISKEDEEEDKNI